MNGIWITPAELIALPTTGDAWQNLVAAASAPLNLASITLANQDSLGNTTTLAKALVYARAGGAQYLTDVLAAIDKIANTNTEQDTGSRGLSVGRELAAYVIAADLIQLSSVNPTLDAQFRAKLTYLLSPQAVLPDGRTLVSTHEDRPNNWGTHAGASRIAAAMYLGDTTELNRAAQVFQGWLGDTAAYNGFSYGNTCWQSDPNNPVGINPVGGTISGNNVDGALPEEMRRGSCPQWPPTFTDYAWEAMQGAIVQAELLENAGYPSWQWSSQALLRATNFLTSLGWPPTGDDTWQPWILNKAYGTTLVPATSPTSPGKNLGWTDWTHGMTAVPVQNVAPVVNAGVDQQIYTLNTTVVGSVQDDGLLFPLNLQWTAISGPGVVSFATPTQLTTGVTFSNPGLYTLRLSAHDGQYTTNDVLVVEILNTPPPPNLPPVVTTAATPSTLTLPLQTVQLEATIVDDTSYSSSWTQVSGPPSTIINPSSDTTAATLSTAGTYVFQVTVQDGLNTVVKQVTVTLNEAPIPVVVEVDAGQARVIDAGHTTQLVGTYTGLTNPETVWSQLSGPAAIITPTGFNPVDVTLTIPGVYTFQFDADGYTDTVVITVQGTPVGEQITVDAGPDKSLFWPMNSVFLNGTVIPENTPVVWFVSGPGSVQLQNSPTATAVFSAPGEYTLTLCAEFEPDVCDTMKVTITERTVTAPAGHYNRRRNCCRRCKCQPCCCRK